MEVSPINVPALCSRFRERSHRYLTQQLKLHGLGELAPSHGDVLVALMRGGPMPMKDLAAAIDRDKSTLSGMVHRLAELGYVSLGKDEADSRVIIVKPTSKTMEQVENFKQMGRDFMVKMYEGFSEAEKLMLAELLDRLNNNME